MEPTRFLSVLSICVAPLLVRRSLALTPLIRRLRRHLPPRWGRLLLFYKPFYSHTRFRFFCTQAFTLEGEGGFSGAGRKKTRMRVCFLLMEPTRFLSVLSFYVVLLLVRRSLALTPLFHRKRSPFPPSGEGLGGESYLGRSARRLPSPSREGLVGDCYLGRGACGEPSPLRGKVGFSRAFCEKLG